MKIKYHAPEQSIAQRGKKKREIKVILTPMKTYTHNIKICGMKQKLFYEGSLWQ